LVEEYRHKKGGKQTERKVKEVKWGREWGAGGGQVLDVDRSVHYRVSQNFVNTNGLFFSCR
jgi:hypothetical protein